MTNKSLPDAHAEVQKAALNTAQHTVKGAPMTAEAVQAICEPYGVQPLQPLDAALAAADMPVAAAGDETHSDQPISTFDRCDLPAAGHQRLHHNSFNT